MALYTVTTVADHQRGLRYRAGRLVRWLEPGRRWLVLPGAGTVDTVLDLRPGYTAWTPELAAIVPHGASEVVDVPHRALALVSRDGLPCAVLPAGRWLLWQLRARVEATVTSLEPLFTEIPDGWWPYVPSTALERVEVGANEQLVLHADGVCHVLGPGRYGLHVEHRVVRRMSVDLREQELAITGQDVMTADKVTVRINLVVRFKVTDPARLFAAVPDLQPALYAHAQLAARRLVAAHTLDQLLEARTAVADRLVADVAPRAAEWGVAVATVDLKDVILPGEMRVILNQVIEAEKRAAANVILRREETQATRSLANTAKLLDQNPVLLRLKELEALERVAERVGQVTIVASPDRLLGALDLGLAGRSSPVRGG